LNRKKQSGEQLEDNAVTGITGRFKAGKKAAKPNLTASINNRSLALRKTLGLTESEWELSLTDCSHSCFYSHSKVGKY
jgi:hypothetical protein